MAFMASTLRHSHSSCGSWPRPSRQVDLWLLKVTTSRLSAVSGKQWLPSTTSQHPVNLPAAGARNHKGFELFAPQLVRGDGGQLVPDLVQLGQVLNHVF